MARRRSRRRDSGVAPFLLFLFILLGGRLGPRGGSRRIPPPSPGGGPWTAPPGNDNDNLGTAPLPPNPLAMPAPEPGVIVTPHWPTNRQPG